MAVGCGAKCAKAMLIVFNIIFWLSGCALLGVGIWLRVDTKIVDTFDLVDLDSDNIQIEYAAYLLIAVGAFVFLVGFLGCCGAIKENKCCLGTYIFLLLVVMAAELAAGILAIIYRQEILKSAQGRITEELKKDGIYSMEADGKVKYTVFGLSISTFQANQKCCGINGSADYDNSAFFRNQTGADKWRFPFTCCKLNDEYDEKNPQPSDVVDADDCRNKVPGKYYTDGCFGELEELVETNALILIGIGIGIACLEVFGIIFAICLCRNLGELE